jgi:hypothetical protein
MSKNQKHQLRKAAIEAAQKASAPTPSPVLSGQPKTSAERASFVKATITAAYRQATPPDMFPLLLEDAGYLMARSEYDNLIVVDASGKVFDLQGHIEGIDSKKFLALFGYLVATLPTLDEARTIQRVKHGTAQPAPAILPAVPIPQTTAQTRPTTTTVTIPPRAKKSRNVVKKVAVPAHAPKPPKSRSGTETRQVTKVVGTRCSDEDLAKIDKAASDAGLSRADYVRRQILETPSKVRSIRRPSIEVKAVAGLTAQLGKIGSNLNQIAHDLNTALIVEDDELRRVLSQLRRTIEEDQLATELAALREVRPLLFAVLERKP